MVEGDDDLGAGMVPMLELGRMERCTERRIRPTKGILEMLG